MPLPCTKQFCITISQMPDPCTGVATDPSQMMWSASTGGGTAAGANGSFNLGVAVSEVVFNSQICVSVAQNLAFAFSADVESVEPVLPLGNGGQFVASSTGGGQVWFTPVGVSGNYTGAILVGLNSGLNNIQMSCVLTLAGESNFPPTPAGTAVGGFTVSLQPIP